MTPRRLHNDRRGVAAVEFGLLTVFLVPLFLGIVDMALVADCAQKVATAAEDGASYCVHNATSCTLANIRTAVQAATPLNITAANITGPSGGAPQQTGCANGNTVTLGVSTCAGYNTVPQYVSVTVSYTYTPIFWPSTIVLNRTALARIS